MAECLRLSHEDLQGPPENWRACKTWKPLFRDQNFGIESWGRRNFRCPRISNQGAPVSCGTDMC